MVDQITHSEKIIRQWVPGKISTPNLLVLADQKLKLRSMQDTKLVSFFGLGPGLRAHLQALQSVQDLV